MITKVDFFSSPVWANMELKRVCLFLVLMFTFQTISEGITHKLGEVIMQTKIGGGTSGYFGELRHRGTAVTDNGKIFRSGFFHEII